MAKPDKLQITLNSLLELGAFLKDFVDKTNNVNSNLNEQQESLYTNIQRAKHYNAWFTEEEILFSLTSWSQALTEKKLTKWLDNYSITTHPTKQIGLVLAGNVPLVGLHDIICVLLSGNDVLAKYSSKDPLLMQWIRQFLIEKDSSFEQRFKLIKEQLKDFDAVIATGSNNTARYFEYYFRSNPHIIRKNRNSVAILTGEENSEDFQLLAEDIFRYFGLGCRSVSKLLVPKGYDFKPFFEGIFHKKEILQHNQYVNNYDYNKAVYLMSNVQLLDNGFIILKEDSSHSSPIGCLFYEYYQSIDELENWVAQHQDQLQCVVGNTSKSAKIDVSFGQSQHPELWNYADGVDTMEFLLKLA